MIGSNENRPGQRDVTGVLVWGLAFAGSVCAYRLLVLLVFAHTIDLGVVLAALPETVLVGAVLGFLMLGAPGVLGAVLVRCVVTLLLAVNFAAFHYEVVFSRLPTAGVLFYLRDLGELGPSMVARGQTAVFVLGVVLVGVFLEIAARRLRVLHTPAQRRAAWLTIVACAMAVVMVHLVGRTTGQVHPSRLRSPLTWLAESSIRRHEIRLDEEHIGPQSVLWWQQAMGHERPFGGGFEAYPLCTPGSRGRADEELHSSAILLILESVGSAELELVIDGRPLMPRLHDFARRHLFFPRIMAAGTKSGSAMPGLFSGVPPQTFKHLLHRVPLNTFRGFPEVLSTSGYRTAYFHGADLNWEYQRSFLRMVGVQEINERDPLSDTPVYGWGYSDEEMLGRLRSWIEEHRAREADEPFFSALFTLSSHDPYDLPEQWPRSFDDNDTRGRQYEALAYLDHHLGRFLEWYEREEAPRGTVLVLVGDHAPHLFNTVATDHGAIFRFQMPMVISAPGRQVAATDPASRRGAHHDLPATLMSVLGFPPLPCDQGVDLLMSDAQWPDDRVVYSVGGEELEEVQLWLGDEHVLVDRLFRGVRRLTPVDGASPSDQISERARRFLGILFPLNRFLMTEDAYGPPAAVEPLEGAPLPTVRRPLVVSHRGNVHGPGGDQAENTVTAVSAALAAGFPAVEVDLQLSADGRPVLHHDAALVDSRGANRPVLSLTAAQLRDDHGIVALDELLATHQRDTLLLELKAQADFDEQLALGVAVAEAVQRSDSQQRIIIDSFSLPQVTAAQPICGCEVGWDLPYREPVTTELLRAAVLARMDWIFVEHSALTVASIAAAHELGLRVMAYTVNDEEGLWRLQPELPDGLITDRLEVLHALQ